MQDLRGKVAVVTGAGSGIGRALAVQLVKEGCAVALADINDENLQSLAAELKSSGVRVTTHVLDVAKRAAVYAFADEVLALHGSAQIIINNAGVAVSQTVAELTYDDFEWLMGINFWGVVYGTKAFLPHLLKNNEGHIVNVSSIFGIVAFPTQSAYNASKFAVRGFTESLREELAATNVQVSCVCPGGIKTNIARSARFYRDMNGMQDHRRAVANFDKITHTSPAAAAQVILDGIRGNQARILIGADARLLDRVQRLLPTRYGRFLSKLSGVLRRRN